MQLFSEMCNCTYIFAICANFVHNLASCQSHYGRAKARFANSLRAQQKYQNVTTLLWADIHSAHWKPQDMCLDSKKHLFPIQKNINIGAMYISGTRNSWFVCWKCLQNDNESLLMNELVLSAWFHVSQGTLLTLCFGGYCLDTDPPSILRVKKAILSLTLKYYQCYQFHWS